MLPVDKITVYKDGKCYDCTLELMSVRGGSHVLYRTADGTVLKQEPLFRLNERVKRRKGVGHTIKL